MREIFVIVGNNFMLNGFNVLKVFLRFFLFAEALEMMVICVIY